MRIVAAARVRVGDEEPMSVVLLVIGLLVTAAGFVTIGFGIPINAFSLGNTLIISGTVAVSSGLILVALAMAVRQLKRIAEALRSQASRRRLSARLPSRLLSLKLWCRRPRS